MYTNISIQSIYQVPRRPDDTRTNRESFRLRGSRRDSQGHPAFLQGPVAIIDRKGQPWGWLSQTSSSEGKRNCNPSVPFSVGKGTN